MIYGGKNDTNGGHLAVFSLEVAFAHHFVAAFRPLVALSYCLGTRVHGCLVINSIEPVF